MSVYAFAGEVVTCERGHPMAQFKCTVNKHDVCDPTTLYFADGSKPQKGAPLRSCKCGAEAFRSGNGGFIAHIAGQWRHSAPDDGPLNGARLWDNS